jgi:hypothetical protein
LATHRSRVCQFVIDLSDLDQGLAFWTAALDRQRCRLLREALPVSASIWSARNSALAGPDNWGTETTSDGDRIVWARLDLPRALSTS